MFSIKYLSNNLKHYIFPKVPTLFFLFCIKNQEIMGLLKHAILPLFVLVDLAFMHKLLIAQDIDFLAELWDRDLKTFPATDLEIHFLHCCGGVCLVLAVNNIAAILIENSHYRGMAVLLHTLFFAVDGGSYIALGRSALGPPLFFVLVGVVGLIVHSMEPGVFTADKNSSKKKK